MLQHASPVDCNKTKNAYDEGHLTAANVDMQQEKLFAGNDVGIAA